MEKKKLTVTQAMVDNSIEKIEDHKLGLKTTVVILTLKNGFEVIGTSACIDPDNYDHEVGVRIAKERAMNRLWELLGFEIQERYHRFSKVRAMQEEHGGPLKISYETSEASH